MNNCCLIGYSGHAYVVFDSVKSMGFELKYYCELNQKIFNPYNLEYLDTESAAFEKGHFKNTFPVLAIGDNNLRKRAGDFFSNAGIKMFTAIHSKSYIANEVSLGEGTVVFAGVVINPLVKIGIGVICNTSCIIEHESVIGNYSHICPGAVIAGNVQVGKNVFVGANSVIKQGIIIGDDAVIGAGSVIVKNVDEGDIIFGNPAKAKLK